MNKCGRHAIHPHPCQFICRWRVTGLLDAADEVAVYTQNTHPDELIKSRNCEPRGAKFAEIARPCFVKHNRNNLFLRSIREAQRCHLWEEFRIEAQHECS